MYKKVIAFSLWGKNPKYLIGAIENVKLAEVLFPDWEVWIFYGLSTPEEYISKLTKFNNCRLIKKDTEGDWSGMFWRFEPASNPDVSVMISRDCDSRLSKREKAAVEEWLKSDKRFHIMRDHPWHNIEILGGMWGAKYPVLANMNNLLKNELKGDYWQVDQEFLKKEIYPIIKNDCLVHDPFFNYESLKKDFPSPRRNYEFVGESFDENGQPNYEHRLALLQHIINPRYFKIAKYFYLFYWKHIKH